MRREIIKKNWIFIVLIIVGITCCISMNKVSSMNIISNPDSQIIYSLGENVLEQTWLSEVKEIKGVGINAVADSTFEAEFQINILNGRTREVVESSLQRIRFESGEETSIVFSFPTIKNCQGEQYIFQLQCVSNENEGNIAIASGRNYAGCSLNGVDQQQGVALDVVYITSGVFSWLFISLFPFLTFSLLFMVICNKKWEECIGLSTGLVIFVLYIAGIVGLLEKGILFIYILSLVAFITTVILYNKKDLQISDLNSYGLIIYGLVVLLILVNCHDARYAKWDEFSHWGLAAKDMFYNNSFARHMKSTVMIQYYPPVTAIMEYFFCYTNRLFLESSTYVGFQILVLNLLSAGLGVCKNRNPMILIPTFSSLILIPIIFFNDIYNCLYTDSMLAIEVAYILICFFIDKMDGFNFIRILSGLFLLTLTKYTGVVLAGIVFAIIIGDIIYKQYRKKRINLKEIGISAVLAIWICILFISWQYYLKMPIENKNNDVSVEITESMDVSSDTKIIDNRDVDGNEDILAEEISVSSGINLSGIMELFTGEAPEYRYVTIKNYIHNLLFDKKYSFGATSMPYMFFSITVLIFAFVVSLMCANKEDKEDLFLFGILTFIANMGYCAFQLLTYLFTFPEREAVNSASYGRYLASYLCGIVIVFSIITIKKLEYGKKKFKQGIMLLLTIALIVVAPLKYFRIKNEDVEYTDEYVYGYEELANILQTSAKGGDKVYFVCNNTNGSADLQFRTAIVPMMTDYMTANIFSSEESFEKQNSLYEESEIKPYLISVEEWGQKLCDYQYVVIFHSNEVFAESYGTLFEEENTISDGSVYKVCQEQGSIVLKQIGKTEIKKFF